MKFKLLVLLTFNFCLLTFIPLAHAQDSNQLYLDDFNPEAVPKDPPTFPGVELPKGEDWVKDKDVTFAGKFASRSQHVLNWVLENYQWAKDGKPFQQVWISVRDTVYALLGLLILAAAFLLIITRGRSLTIRKFIPTFVLVLVLITLSFSLIQFLYQLTDIIQGFFLNRDGQIISGENLLNIGFNYQDFEGLKLYGRQYAESAFVSTWLVKLTAITYYLMSAVLILRKVILWFFLIVSPVLPLLFLLPALRNSGKIWLGEFLRWLLYAPLFAILLSGLVALWKLGIPLNFNFSSADKYPTSINILLGGPGQQVGKENSLNSPETFIQYIVALLMLWVVIILPFILLKIIIDYARSYSVTESSIIKYLTKTSSPLMNHFGQPGSSGAAASDLARSTSVIKSDSSFLNHPPVPQKTETIIHPDLPFRSSKMPDLKITGASLPSEKAFERPPYQPIPSVTTGATMPAAGSVASNLATTDLLDQTNLRIPTLSDVVRFDSGLISRDSLGFDEASKVYSEVKIPDANLVQSVSPAEFEQIRATWEENYRRLTPPPGPDNKAQTRKQWLVNEVHKIPEIIDNLLSGEADRIKQAKEALSKILPFLLLGGFSKDEIIAYLKAKLEAAKKVLAEILQED